MKDMRIQLLIKMDFEPTNHVTITEIVCNFFTILDWLIWYSNQMYIRRLWVWFPEQPHSSCGTWSSIESCSEKTGLNVCALSVVPDYMCSPHRLIQGRHFPLKWYFSFKGSPLYRKSSLSGKSCPWLACANCKRGYMVTIWNNTGTHLFSWNLFFFLK